MKLTPAVIAILVVTCAFSGTTKMKHVMGVNIRGAKKSKVSVTFERNASRKHLLNLIT